MTGDTERPLREERRHLTETPAVPRHGPQGGPTLGNSTPGTDMPISQRSRQRLGDGDGDRDGDGPAGGGRSPRAAGRRSRGRGGTYLVRRAARASAGSPPPRRPRVTGSADGQSQPPARPPLTFKQSSVIEEPGSRSLRGACTEPETHSLVGGLTPRGRLPFADAPAVGVAGRRGGSWGSELRGLPLRDASGPALPCPACSPPGLVKH